MSKLPTILSRQQIAKTRLFRVEQLDLEFSNGAQRRYERLIGGERGSVLVVPMIDDETVLLIREYSAGSQDYQLGLPKGRMERDEAPLEAANREIREEIGYGARDLRLLKTFTIAPAYIRHQTHVILARDLYPDRQPGDEPEPIEVVPWRLRDWDELIGQPDLTEARSIAALYLTRDLLA
ncbi:MAG: ADP compounds hydrolase NudE [gamma proteobacterium symbiont of Ctena orbiculata]|nr:ADP compounds hydrolase NudE [Candidatus Thiodiazotropha sp. (ex Lucina pensylvanica)]PUB72043.1 MAG: ADP compounds hydrolase NudE [gamma proteobacterium symbiont of Ctena orbiculata]PUB79161.1 MAG: ADP compounds hydrolase NudE [gamma proteobacterium symbiont of Ctena orbiculata]